MITVLLVDDQVRLLLAWEKLLAAQPDMKLAGTLQTADDLLNVVQKSPPNVVVLDLSMPGLNPLKAIRELADRYPDVRTIVLSAHADHDTVQSAFGAGAWGYVDKLAPPAQVLEIIRRVAAGEVVFPADMRQ